MKNALLAIAILASFSSQVFATVWWDTNGATAGASDAITTAPGTWDGVTANFSTSSAGTAATAVYGADTTVRFAAGTVAGATAATGAYTVTVSGTRNVTVLGIEEGDITFTGGTLNFINAAGATSLLTGISGGEADSTTTMNSLVSGTNGFRMARSTVVGTHILNLNNTSNSFTGGLGINSGQTIRLGASGVIPDANVVGFNTAAAANTLDLQGNSETVAALNQEAGTAAPSVILGAGTLTLANPTGQTFLGVISGAGSVVKNGAGTQIFTGANTYTGGTTIGAGTLQIGNGGTTGAISNTGTLTNNGNVTFNRSNTYTYTGTITGTGSLTKAGAGVLSLGGTNSYDGATLINVGAIQATSATALGNSVGNTQVANGAELRYDGAAANFTVAEAIQLGGGAGLLSEGALNVRNSANVTFSGPITLTGASTIAVSSSATTALTNANAITGANQNLTLQGGSGAGGGGTISGAISLGTGSLTKLQGGTWTLSNPTGNSYSGGTAIGISGTSGGTLAVTNTSGSGTGSGNITIGGGSNTGTLNVGTGGAGGSVSGDISFNNTSNTSTVNFNRSDNSTYGGVISGANGVVNKNGAGTLSLTSANTYGGGTTINAGTLQANNATGSATGGGAVTINTGGTLAGSGAVAGAVTVNGGGTLAPGTSIESLGIGASLSFIAASTFAAELDTSASPTVGADLVNVNGALSIAAGAILSLVDLNSVYAGGVKFTLISYAGTWDNGIFLGVPDDSLVTVGANAYVVNYNDTGGGSNFGGGIHGNYLTLTAVPELSAFIFGGLVCCMVGMSYGVKVYRRNRLATKKI